MIDLSFPALMSFLSLTTPGQVTTLDSVSGLALVSPDAGHWSIALLRMAADAPTPDPGLTLLAFGNVEIRNLTLFQAADGNGDLAPVLSFSSRPVPGEHPETGGIIVYNPSHEEPLSISLNGADLTLASSAVVEAQPGNKMIVTSSAGSALVNTAAGDGALLQAYQLTVLYVFGRLPVRQTNTWVQVRLYLFVQNAGRREIPGP